MHSSCHIGPHPTLLVIVYHDIIQSLEGQEGNASGSPVVVVGVSSVQLTLLSAVTFTVARTLPDPPFFNLNIHSWLVAVEHIKDDTFVRGTLKTPPLKKEIQPVHG